MRKKLASAGSNERMSYEDGDLVYGGKGSLSLPTSEDSPPATYPLNIDDYQRLKRRKMAHKQIIQTMVPALCEVEMVQISKHDLSTIPLKAALTSDPAAESLLSPDGIVEHEAEDSRQS